MDPNSLNSVNPGRQKVSTFRLLQTTLTVGLVLATLFTAFPPTILTTSFNDQLSLLLTPQPQTSGGGILQSQELHIGIIAGHWGNDAGAVCANGMTEQKVNLDIANIVQQQLSKEKGYKVDLLQEYDSRLNDYQGTLLVSIHNDSCVISNELTTGFKIAPSNYSRNPERDSRLADCLQDRYKKATSLSYHAGSITPDMTDYHAFREINTETTAVIIETGFLSNPVDYGLLTEHPDQVAQGIVNGILCYLNNESIDASSLSTATP